MPQNKHSNIREQKQRMDPEHIFEFNCYQGVSCFTQCCKDITIVLTPYDVFRLKKGLGISSDEFLEKYALIIPKEERLIPLVILEMKEKDKKCPFVSQDGCIVYDDRPWACRMYPLDMSDDGTFHLIADPMQCQGLNEKNKWRIGEWLVDQGIVPYDKMNSLFSSIIMPLQAHKLDIDNPKITKMIFMALYNLDKFKKFVFKSSFLDRFDVDPRTVEKIKRDDAELLKFGFDWIKFGIFGEKLFWIKQES